MDVLSELENMAKNVMDDGFGSREPNLSHSVITQWQQLFCYSRSDAISRIQEHRSNFTREKVSDEHWELVRCTKGAEGYDREAYEHQIQLERTK